MLSLKNCPFVIFKTFEADKIPTSTRSTVVCAAKGPRPRYPRVWKTKQRIGTISKSAKLVQTIKDMSNVKEEVYGALDSFVAWELEFPLITVKKALKTLEDQQEWKRIIQVIKWMLSKGQGRTMGSYFMLINALAEDDRLEEAEELWTNLLMRHMESMPRKFFDKMIAIYHKRGMHQKMFEVFADMEELGIQPSIPVVSMVGNVFLELGMQDKHDKLHRKYPPPKWVYRYIKGKRIKIKVRRQDEPNKVYKELEKLDDDEETSYVNGDKGPGRTSNEFRGEFKQDSDDIYEEPEQTLDEIYEKTEHDFDVHSEKTDIRLDDSL